MASEPERVVVSVWKSISVSKMVLYSITVGKFNRRYIKKVNLEHISQKDHELFLC